MIVFYRTLSIEFLYINKDRYFTQIFHKGGCLLNLWKATQHCQSSGNCKSGWDRNMHPFEWIKWKRQIITKFEEVVKQLGCLWTSGGCVNLHNHFGIWFDFLTKANIVYKPLIPLMIIYKRNVSINARKICTRIFLAALFIIARIGKHPKCSSRIEWRNNLYSHTMDSCKLIRKNDYCHMQPLGWML